MESAFSELSETIEMNPSVLFLDDDPMLLVSVSRILKDAANVFTAPSPDAAEEILASNPGIEVIFSDLRMPEVNGVQFLEYVASEYPEIVRIMLTAAADHETALEAINRANVFRLLEKPCPFDALAETVREASAVYREQFRIRNQHREDHEGAMRILVTLLQHNSPSLWEVSLNAAGLAHQVAGNQDYKNPDGIRQVAQFAFVGLAVSDRKSANQFATGTSLEEGLRAKVLEGIKLSQSLCQCVGDFELTIPWGELLFRSAESSQWDAEIRLIELCFELERDAATSSRMNALTLKLEHEQCSPLDRKVLEHIQATLIANREIKQVSNHQLVPGMVLALPVISNAGTLLIKEETELDVALIERLHGFAENARIPNKKLSVFGRS